MKSEQNQSKLSEILENLNNNNKKTAEQDYFTTFEMINGQLVDVRHYTSTDTPATGRQVKGKSSGAPRLAGGKRNGSVSFWKTVA